MVAPDRPTPGDGNGSSPGAEALAVLIEAATQAGVEPLELLRGFDEADDDRQNLGTRPGELAPGENPKPTLILTDDERLALEGEIEDFLDRHDVMMAERWETEQEIRDNYGMRWDPMHGGIDQGSAQMVSEKTMNYSDQVAARITNAITHAQPPIRVDPVFSESLLGESVADEALRTERFLNSYGWREVDLLHLIPPTILRTVKVGQSVWYILWEEEWRTRRYFSREHAEVQVDRQRIGNVRIKLLHNHSVKCWPPTLNNWQRDYTIVGHDEFMTKGEWLRKAKQWNLGKDAVSAIEGNPGELLGEEQDGPKREGIDVKAMEEQKLLSPMVKMTQLWCHMVIPGRSEAERFYLFYHRPTRKITFIDHNPLHSQKHPYFPIPYKIGENSAWATGVGHEALYVQAADTAMRCLEQDNLSAGAYFITLRKPGAGYNTDTTFPRPGATFWVEDPDKDFKTLKLGGEAPELRDAMADNSLRGQYAVGLAPVLSGHGDPTMKSGAGTGSTLALIEQANVKIRYVEKNIHAALSEAFTFMLELVAQYAPDGLYYRYADEADANSLRLLKYVPPRGRGPISEFFRLRVEAPSAATSDETRRTSYMLLWSFALQHAQQVMQWALPVLQQENPAAIPRMMRNVFDFVSSIARRVVEHIEIPDAPQMVPMLPEPTPQDETINQLNQALQQAQTQAQQLQMQVQELTGGQQMPMAPGEEMPMAEPVQ